MPNHYKYTEPMLVRRILCCFVWLSCLLLLSACSFFNEENEIEGLQVAILSDIHFHDVFGEFPDVDYRGVKNPKDGKYALIRTMEAQLHSTRMFNENYFAFLAALDDIAQRNIKYVIIPGDFSDDGQAVHMRALKNILERYSRAHDMFFFLTIGNHDVVQPFGRESSKRDFLGRDGKRQPIMSKPSVYQATSEPEHPVIVTPDIKNLGYSEITGFLADFGFFPRKEYIFWSTPFSDYDYDSYSFPEAQKSSSFVDRSYTLPRNGVPIPDASYLVEPVNGLWLLALDGNTYLNNGEDAGGRPSYVNGSGHDAIIKHRGYVIDWVKEIAKEAENRGKTLIAFSHYPMVDYNDGATDFMNELIKREQRVPTEEVAQLFADAGITIHFGGHIHINNTGTRTTEHGNTLVNIQVPSLAAYLPAYKILKIGNNNRLNIETVVLDSVPGFDHFFELYEREYEYLDSIGHDNIWDRKILDSKNYREFINWHLKELVRLRLLPEEWPQTFSDFVLSLTGGELLVLSLESKNLALTDLLSQIRRDTQKSSTHWDNAIRKAEENNLHFDDFMNWSGVDLFYDLYRIRGAGELAFQDIEENRLAGYRLVIDSFLQNGPGEGDMRKDMILLMSVFQKFLAGTLANHFELDLGSGEVFVIKSGQH